MSRRQSIFRLPVSIALWLVVFVNKSFYSAFKPLSDYTPGFTNNNLREVAVRWNPGLLMTSRETSIKIGEDATNVIKCQKLTIPQALKL